MYDFEKGLIDWHARPSVERTWINFQSHFESAHNTLRKVWGISIKNENFLQQVNHISDSLLNQIKEDDQSAWDEIRNTEVFFCQCLKILQTHNNVVMMILLP